MFYARTYELRVYYLNFEFCVWKISGVSYKEEPHYLLDDTAGVAMGTEIVVHNVDDYQKLSKSKISKALYEYLASGTDDEQTLAENRSAWKMWYLRPRILKPVSALSTATYLFGQVIEMPVFVSPAGVMALCDPKHGECAAARACGRMGTMFALSQHATRSIEQVAEGAPNTNRWYQAYILKDRDMVSKYDTPYHTTLSFASIVPEITFYLFLKTIYIE